MPGQPIEEIPLRNFSGLNLRDAADRVDNNEFTLLTNVWQPSKGSYFNRFGTTALQTSPPLASRISGIHRHYNANGDRIALLHCVPNSTTFPDNTVDLVLAEVADASGDLFGGGAIETMRFCYSWIGAGLEQTYNSKSRAGFPAGGSFPLDAWSNPAHQSIVVGAASSSINVTIPAFPSGIRGANIFAARGVHSQMTYVGTITTSAGTLKVSEFIALQAAFVDAPTPTASAQNTGGGTLTPGVYYVGVACLADSGSQEGSGFAGLFSQNTGYTQLAYTTTVNVPAGCNSIHVAAQAAASANGARAFYIFVSTAPINRASATFVALVRKNTTYDVLSIPHHNASSIPYFTASIANILPPCFWNGVNDGFIGGAAYVTPASTAKINSRFGFVLAQKDPSATLYEVFPSRSQIAMYAAFSINKVYSGDAGIGNDNVSKLHNFVAQPRTQNDTYQSTTPYVWAYPPTDPQWAYLLGVSYFVNSIDIPWQTDGYSLCQIFPILGSDNKLTLLPPIPKCIFTYNSALVIGGSQAGNQLYGSNATAPSNWVTTGVGTALRFVTVGDALGPGITATGTFTPQTEATSNPSSFMIGFKKNGCWMVASITDPATSTISGNLYAATPAPMIQTSGRVGCVAYQSVVNTPMGTIFLGQDANVYLIMAVAEPRAIGTKIQNLLLHLVGNDAAMQSVTATYHDRHYKLSYPSAANVALGNTYCDAEVWADLRTEDGDRILWMGPHSGVHVGPQTVYTGSGDNMIRVVADNYTGSLVRLAHVDDTSTLSDFGTAVVPVVTSKIYRFKSEAHMKRTLGALLDIYLDYSYNNALLLELFSDSFYGRVNKTISTGGATWDSSQWDQTNFTDAEWFGIPMNLDGTNLIGRTLQWKLTYTGNGPMALAAAVLLTKTERRRIGA